MNLSWNGVNLTCNANPLRPIEYPCLPDTDAAPGRVIPHESYRPKRAEMKTKSERLLISLLSKINTCLKRLRSHDPGTARPD